MYLFSCSKKLVSKYHGCSPVYVSSTTESENSI